MTSLSHTAGHTASYKNIWVMCHDSSMVTWSARNGLTRVQIALAHWIRLILMALDLLNMPKSMRLSVLARSDAPLKWWKYCWCTMQHMSVHTHQGKLWLFFTAASRIIDLSQTLLFSFTRAIHCHFPIFFFQWLPHAGLLEKKTGRRTTQVAGSSLLTCASGIIRKESSQTQSIALTSHTWPMFLDAPSHLTETFSTQR